MDNLQKTLLISLVSVSLSSWIIARTYQVDMMSAMMTPTNPISVSLFVAVWTAGMAAMMFPAISPVVLLYNRLIKTKANVSGSVIEESDAGPYPLKMILFIGSYLAVWSVTGLALLLLWTLPINAVLAPLNSASLSAIFGAILILAGVYQFSLLKSKCLGYCESPMSLFMRRWKKGTFGAVSMGTYHGLYCLGCCWPYFLIMVALGWMNILWMALFAGIIFGEKMWAKGIWVARAAGVGLAVVGILSVAGIVTVVPTHDAMSMTNDESMSGMVNDESPEASKDMSPADTSTETEQGDDKMDGDPPGMKM